MNDHDRRVRHLAAQQHGLITAAQARGIGLSSSSLAHRVAMGDLRWLSQRVLAIEGTPDTELQRVLFVALDAGPGSALSHTTALAHWGVRGFLLEPVHVVRHRAQHDHPVPGAHLHEVRFLPRREVRTLEGVPVVSPSLALLQVAGLASVSTSTLARAIDAAWSDRLVSPSSLAAIDAMMSRQGRRGIVRFRQLVEERGPGYIPPASNLEARFASLLDRAGLPRMQRQVDCSSEEGWIGRVDFRDLTEPFVVEIQSERFHRGLTAQRADRDRIERLDRSGLEVLELSDTDLFLRGPQAIARVQEARARAARRRAA
jgi:hypothetical protein